MAKSIAKEIMEPLEDILKDLVRLSTESVDIPVSSTRVNTIIQNMDNALTSVRRNVESLLEATMPPDDYYDVDEKLPGGDNYSIIEVGVNQFLRYAGFPAVKDDESPEPTNYETLDDEDFMDIAYMTAPRDDGGEK